MSILKLIKWFMIDQFTFGVGGGDSPGPQTNVTNTSNLPEYVRPYVESMLGSAQQQVYNFNPDGTVSGFKPYTPYSSNMNDYQAGFSPMQQQSYEGAQNLQTPGQFNQASQMLGMAGLGSLQAAGQLSQAGQNYSALPSSYLSAQAPQLQDYSMQGPANVRGARTQAAQLGNAPTAQAEGFGQPGDVRAQNVSAQNVSAQNVNAPTMQAAQTDFNPNLNQYQMGPASQVSTQSFNQPGTAESYMNPYLSASLSPQLDEIRRQYGVSQTNQMSNATKQGAFGGSREALMAAENQRNMNTGMNQAITQGYNTAFNNAQQQFNTQQQANLTAQQANQQAGLTTGQQNLAAKLGVQQLGTQTGLQAQLANLSNQQQAAVNNQATQFQANGMNAQQAMQAALANQQSGLQAQQLNQSAGLQAGLANQQTAYNSGLQNAQMRQQANLANQSLAGQYGLQQGSMNQQANLANQQTAQQANLANQQMGYNVGNTNLQSRLGVQQLGAGQNLQAQLANQGAYGQAQQLAANQQQFGANLGLQGLQGALSGYSQLGQAAGALGQVGSQQLAAQQGIINTQNQMGAQQQAAEQAKINQAIQNYATAQQYPMMQLANINNLLRGLPMQSSTTQTYQAPPSALSQIGGLAATGLGAFGAAGGFGKAKGGTVKSYAEGGLVKLAINQAVKGVK